MTNPKEEPQMLKNKFFLKQKVFVLADNEIKVGTIREIQLIDNDTNINYRISVGTNILSRTTNKIGKSKEELKQLIFG